MAAKETLRTGKCLCGLVSVSVGLSQNDVGVCYCEKCRKWTGGPFMELECGQNVSFTGIENIQKYDSSSWGERGFCNKCGSHIYIKDKRSGEYGVPASIFDDDSGLELKRQVFSDRKPDYYTFTNKTVNITSAYIHENYPETKESND